MWHPGLGYWGWGWWFLLALIAFVVIWLAAAVTTARRMIRPEERILRERYAAGEITREEFQQRLKDLRRVVSRRLRPAEEQILRERYARGEITSREFHERLRDLRRAA